MTEKKDISDFEKKVNYDFKNKSLLKQAFVHRSYLNENPQKKISHNERLEFLGDAVLELSATRFLYDKFPEKKEGELTAYRSALVNTQSLSLRAKSLQMDEYLLMSKGERHSQKGREHILANTFEAFVGALYLDSGFERADVFLKKYLFPYLNEILEKSLHKDPKSHFQELAQEKFKKTPEYKTLSEEGPDHDKVFKVALYVGEKKFSEGVGTSKQKAQSNAAEKALEKLRKKRTT